MDLRYAWLILALMFLGAWLCVFGLRKDLRKEMLIISISLCAFAFTEQLYFGSYWSPVHLIKIAGLNVGIEDFIYTFAIAGLAAVTYDFVFRKLHKRSSKNRDQHSNKWEALITIVTGIIFTLALELLTGWSLIVAASLGFIVSGLTAMYFRPPLWKPLLLNAILFALLALVFELITELLAPGFSSFWNHNATLGIYLFNFPFEEFLFHFSWALAVGVLFEIYFGLDYKRR